MSDVFLSYASEDRERAAQLAHALGQQGWSVWWDRKIIAGQAFDQAIERELEAARAVVVLWSVNSIASEWVKNEAAVAAERGVLVPALIDSVKLPLEFRRKQTADLVGWQGDEAHSGFQGLCQGVAHAMGNEAPAPRLQPVAPPEAKRSRWMVPALVALALALGVGLYALGSGPSKPAPGPAPVVEVPAPAAAEAAAAAAAPATAAPGLADRVVGTYRGDVIADSQGSSRSDIEVTISRIDRTTVRVSSNYRRIQPVDVNLTRNGNQIFAADGNSPFIVDLDRSPPTLVFDPRGELAYRGTRVP
jgi:hypothetical protein